LDGFLEYYYDAKKRPLSNDVPPLGKTIEGFVAAKMFDWDEENATVVMSLPSGDVIEVGSDALTE